MRLGLFAAPAALLALGIASPADRASGRVAAPERPATVLAMRPVQRSGAELLRVDRRTLAPTGRRRVSLGPNPGAWALSPNGKHVAIGAERALGLRIVDVVRMRRVADVKTRNGQILAAAWLTARRIVGVEATGLFVVDPVARRLVASGDLAGHPVGVGRTSDALVLLLAPTDQLGFARLAVIDSEGRVRSVVLDRILAGWRRWEDGEPANEYQRPALAVDATGGRGFVVGSGAPVAEVDFRSLSVTYHGLARREPAARAKGPIAGSSRVALWLGGGLLAVTGEDGRAIGPGQVATTPAGLTLVDTRSWSERMLDRSANSVTYVAGTVLAMSQALSQDLESSIGLLGFDRTGSRRFHLFGERAVAVLETLDERVFVEAGGAIRAVNVRTGRVSGVPRELPSLLVGSMRRY